MRIGCRDSREELDSVSAANITEFLFAVLGELAFFAGLHLVEVLWADLLALWGWEGRGFGAMNDQAG